MARIEGCVSSVGMKMSKSDVAIIGIGHEDENQALELLFGPGSNIRYDGDIVATSYGFMGHSHDAPGCVHAVYDSPTQATFTTGCRQ